MKHKWTENASLYIKRQDMSRIIYMWELYNKILNVHGSIFEFGVRYGQDLAMFESFRGMLEPFNYNRRIIGFDTFSGFPSVEKIDNAKIGDMNVPKGYEEKLESILTAHEKESPLSHIKKFELIKGNAEETLEEYFENNNETIIALAYFDFDLYKPTKSCLELCQHRFTKGSIIAFDELNHREWKGETIALNEVFGIKNVRIQRFPFMPTASYIIYE